MFSFDSKLIVDMAVQQFETRHNKSLCDHDIDFAREQVTMICSESIGRLTPEQFKYKYPDYNNDDALKYLEQRLSS